MRKTLLTALVVGLLTIVMAVPALASNGKSGDSNGRPGSDLKVVVTGGTDTTADDVTYDSIRKADLPMKGRFQQLVPVLDGFGELDHLETEFGPGDHGYVGGRWWVDVNADGEMNEGDAFFICPLLGPGEPVG
jgi:hypothetical protein